MERGLMSNEENCAFDVAGYLIVRGALTQKELEAYNRAPDQGRRIDGMLKWPAPLRNPFRDLVLTHAQIALR